MSRIPTFVTASEHVYSVLKQWVLSGELAPGERVDQDAVAARLGVSKMPVRSALDKLAAQDLVLLHSHRGVTVAPLSAEHLEDIYLVRCNLEGLAVQLATERLTPDDASVLGEMIQKQEELANHRSLDTEAILAANREFHMFIYSLAQRPVLLSIIERLWEQSERYRRILLIQPGMVDGSLNEHRRLVELMTLRQAEEASHYLIEHNRKTQQVVLSVMQNNQN
ncbi:DNA-binding GntR family transcriptional regulator [Paenibacillus forsythiae]|uniref:DNA-binding GntR family transcriptional regulator n=1 Tax=Paenibacillus forsythiae TaxID=365616 RepID=A0ABU3HA72_9BACL|nr:GntR family transcriptional regulator [Paenibacillus forsythiae]MDT3427656.1 DNA-binding GntR family transcriptional regulator [Paenibacillus forsythiae]